MIRNLRKPMTITAATLALGLAGCGTSSTVPVATNAAAMTQGLAIEGSVYGGQSPVSGATVQLYAVSTSGYGKASTALLKTAVVTSTTGTFSIASDYTCPTGALVYLVATQGNPGVGASTSNNSALAMMTGLGACSSISGTKIQVNELTTVASVWALAPFMTSYSAVGTSSTNVQGLTNAFATINNIVTTSTGVIPGASLPTGATLPTTLINTLADVLAVCVNSVDQTPGTFSTNCSSLFSDTPSTSGTPTDTIQAAINLAHNPTLSLSPLMSLVNAEGAPYQPALSTAPSSWTLAINYVGGGLSTPKAIATDASGDVWVANSGNNSVTELNDVGSPVSGSSGFTAGGINSPSAIALDTSGAPWVANKGNNTITHLATTGKTGTSVSGGGLNAPAGIAIDTNGDVWVSNAGNSSLSEFNSSGTVLSPSAGFTGGGLNLPVAIAIE